MADTCGTVLKVSELLIEKGAKSVIIIVTHGILSGPAIKRINDSDYIEKIIVSDSLPQEENLKICPKLLVFSIIPLLSQAINRLITNESLSELF
jgi:ribose-phosphate pyrophosphokinase